MQAVRSANYRRNMVSATVAGHREGPQIQLQRFRFDDIRRRRRNANIGHCHLWHTMLVEPGELPGIPDIAAMKRQLCAKPERLAAVNTCDRV